MVIQPVDFQMGESRIVSDLLSIHVCLFASMIISFCQEHICDFKSICSCYDASAGDEEVARIGMAQLPSVRPFSLSIRQSKSQH